MSDKPISRGDLVIVVRAAHYHCEKYFGRIDTAQNIELSSGRCSVCDEQVVPRSTVCATLADSRAVIPLSWLRRIDPPSIGEYDRVPVREKVPA